MTFYQHFIDVVIFYAKMPERNQTIMQRKIESLTS